MSTPENLTRPALILVAHGSSRHPHSIEPMLELARLIEQRKLFAEVKAVFMKGEPKVAIPSALVKARPIIVVPMFMGQGYYTDTLVPLALDLENDPSILYTAPVGTHSAMPGLLLKRALLTAEKAKLPPQTSTLYLVAHGSSRPGGSGETAQSILQALRKMGRFSQVELGFLEQEPRAEFWRDTLPKSDVIILPLLVATGAHANQDLPRIFGPAEDSGDSSVSRQKGHTARRVIVASSLGVEPDLVDLVIELATCHYDTSKYQQSVPIEHIDPDTTVVPEPSL